MVNKQFLHYTPHNGVFERCVIFYGCQTGAVSTPRKVVFERCVILYGCQTLFESFLISRLFERCVIFYGKQACGEIAAACQIV